MLRSFPRSGGLLWLLHTFLFRSKSQYISQYVEHIYEHVEVRIVPNPMLIVLSIKWRAVSSNLNVDNGPAVPPREFLGTNIL